MAWKDGFVIEYTDRAWKVNCYKCTYCSMDGSTCIKTGATLRRIANDRWKTCGYFELEERYNTESMRMKAAHGRSRARGGKKSKGKKKKPEKADQGKRQPINNPKVSKKPKLDGISEIVGIGTKVTSPKYGRGKVVGIEDKWVTVAFVKNNKRMRFDIVSAIKNGNLIV